MTQASRPFQVFAKPIGPACNLGCHYCYYHKEFGNIRYFSLSRVESELKYLLKKRPVSLYLMDPTFNQNKKRAKEILKIFIRYNHNTRLHLELRAELLDREMVKLLYKAKIDFLEIGLQSTNQRTLKLINRTFQPHLFKRNISLLNKKRIHWQLQLIDGLPGDDYRRFEKSLDWLFTLKPTSIKIMRFMLLPGTYLREHAHDFRIRYMRRPPYFVKQSNTFSFADLKKTEMLRYAANIWYNVGMLKNSFYLISDKLGISFSEILKEWTLWMEKWHPDIMPAGKAFLDSDAGDMSVLLKWTIYRKMANLSTDFIIFLYKKYKKSDIPDKRLLKAIRKEVRSFLKNKGPSGLKEEKLL